MHAKGNVVPLPLRVPLLLARGRYLGARGRDPLLGLVRSPRAVHLLGLGVDRIRRVLEWLLILVSLSSKVRLLNLGWHWMGRALL